MLNKRRVYRACLLLAWLTALLTALAVPVGLTGCAADGQTPAAAGGATGAGGEPAGGEATGDETTGDGATGDAESSDASGATGATGATEATGASGATAYEATAAVSISFEAAVQSGYIAPPSTLNTGEAVYDLAVAEIKPLFRVYETSVQLYAPISRHLNFERDGGRLVQVYVSAGDYVEEDDLLAEVVFDKAQLEAERAQLSIRQRQFEQQFANEDADRLNEIEQMRNNLTMDMDETESEIHTLQLAKLELAYEQFLTRSQRTREDQAETLADIDEKLAGEQIRAPFSGIIRYANSAKEGSLIRSWTRMISIDNVNIIQLISEAPLDALRFGDSFTVLNLREPDIHFEARVASDPIVTDTRQGQYRYVMDLVDQGAFLQMLMDNEVDLRRLLTMQLTAQPTNIDMAGVLVVPKSAVRQEDQKQFVNIFEDGVIKKRYVQTGVTILNEVQILDGLEEGQQVVLTY